jgi:hypothetical protein
MYVRTTAHLCSEELTRKNSFVEIKYLGEGAVRGTIYMRNPENTKVTTQSFWKGSIEASVEAANAFYETFLVK